MENVSQAERNARRAGQVWPGSNVQAEQWDPRNRDPRKGRGKGHKGKDGGKY